MKVAVLSFAHERAATYARLLHDLPGVELVLADPGAAADDPARGPGTAARLGVSCVDSWDEVFALRPGAVVVTSEVAHRRELVERAAGAGARVLCEHPLAAKETDAQAMVDACADAGVRLTLASPACAAPAFTAVRQGIADGAVGGLTTLLGTYNTPEVTGDPSAGGALGANAPFLLDMVDAVLGGEPAAQVYAQTNTVLSGVSGVESAALVTVRYPSGIVASIDCGWTPAANHAAAGPAMTFIGDRASVEFVARPRMLGGADAATAAERWETSGTDLYAVMLEDFIAAAGGGQAKGPDGAAGLRTLRVVEAAYESAHTGRPVDVPAPPSARP
jgi:predicted dehydrogenase